MQLSMATTDALIWLMPLAITVLAFFAALVTGLFIFVGYVFVKDQREKATYLINQVNDLWDEIDTLRTEIEQTPNPNPAANYAMPN